MKTSKFQSSIVYIGLTFLLLFGSVTACTPSDSTEGEKLIRYYFDLLTRGDFEAAADLLFEATPGMQGPGFFKN